MNRQRRPYGLRISAGMIAWIMAGWLSIIAASEPPIDYVFRFEVSDGANTVAEKLTVPVYAPAN